MASALIGGLRRAGHAADSIVVVEPHAPQRDKLAQEFGLAAQPAADARLAGAGMVVWAVKPQSFAEAAAPCAPFVGGALQVSVMAGIRSAAIVAASGSARVVRSMPNTPALIGRGIAGLFARPEVSAAERAAVEALFAPTGSALWVAREDDLDAVTALSGSGPAYVFYFIEAVEEAAAELGLPIPIAHQLVLNTFSGAAKLAATSPDPVAVLRERVTSKGGTTERALASMAKDEVKAAIIRAIHAANERGKELGEELGKE
jgi:pyrroline-5-carboxylate reductase